MMYSAPTEERKPNVRRHGVDITIPEPAPLPQEVLPQTYETRRLYGSEMARSCTAFMG